MSKALFRRGKSKSSAKILPIAPSESPEVSISQLENALNKLATDKVSDPLTYRSYLLQLIGQAWEAVADAKPEFVDEQLKRLDRVRWILDDYITSEIDPRVYAAIEVLDTVRNLQVGARALANLSEERRKLTQDEAAILRALVRVRAYLEQEEVCDRILGKVSIKYENVGQMLSALFHSGYLLRYQALVQGSLKSFYAIAPKGRRVLSNHHR